ncbi:MAG: hypothetical protein HQK97_10210 [Nitrospirae bacterium]|nr:hypothetical protein [Nitrospirota bacterium]
MKGVVAVLILLLFIPASAYAEAVAAHGSKGVTSSNTMVVPYTLDDRDRLIRVEARMDALDKRMDGLDKRMDSLKADMDKKFDQLMTFMLWGFGILFGGMGILMTTVIWDRRTALAPAIRKNKELEERGDKMERSLKNLEAGYSSITEVLKRAGLL